jgi:TonB family protein
VRAANPDDYYPAEARRNHVSGRVMVEVPIAPDGRARNPRVIYALPPGVFNDAVRWTVLNTAYEPASQNGVPVRCTLRFFVKFSYDGTELKELKEKFDGTRQKALDGDPSAQFTYGLLLNSRRDFDTKGEDPLSWYLKAAQAGVAEAQFMVGSHLSTGESVDRDPGKAAFWFEQAASRGLAGAQIALANYLLRPEGTRAGREKALGLLEKAVASGSRDGHLYLAAVLAAGSEPDLRNPSRALALVDAVQNTEEEPVAFEIRAAAHAMLGQFTEAQADEKQALVVAKRRKWDLAPLQARLDRYSANQAWSGVLMIY